MVEWFRAIALDHPPLVDAGELVAVALHPWVFRVAVTGACVLAWRSGRRRAALVALVLMATGGALGQGMKLVVHRPRPAWADPFVVAADWSMPSGHAVNAALGTGLLVVLAAPWLGGRRRAWAVVAAGSVTAVTAVDRVLLGVHYASDVVVGAALGTALAMCAGWLARPGRGRGRG